MNRQTFLAALLALGLVVSLNSVVETGGTPNTMMRPSSRLLDLRALRITGNTTPTVGQEAAYTVYVFNNGSSPQIDYQVKLVGPDDSELGSVAGPVIHPHQTLPVVIPWTPTTAGESTICGKVELVGDEVSENNQTDPLRITVLPAGFGGVTIGSGDVEEHFPIDFWHWSSIYETLYLADELSFSSGTITSISLYYSFTDAVVDGVTKIYLGSTTQNDLSAGFIPASQLQLVFDGAVDYPAGENTINIPFQMPYVFTGGNLVALFVRPVDTTFYPSTNYFKCQIGTASRARYERGMLKGFDPFSPPEGVVTNRFPQATFFYTMQLIENDLGVLGIKGSLTPTMGQEARYTVTIGNNGTEAQYAYTVKLMDSNSVELARTVGPPIFRQQTLNVSIPWTPTTTDEIAIHAKVELVGDEMAQNNQSAPIELEVYPPGNHVVTIGEFTELDYIPLDFNCYISLYQTLFFPDELGFSSGTITSIAFHKQFSAMAPNPFFQVWLGSTTQNDLSAGYIPASELTLVFDGSMIIPEGNDPFFIDLQSPYIYTGGNLVLMTFRIFDETIDCFTNFFECQTIGDNRALNTFPNGVFLDPNSPPPGTLTGTLPKTTFFCITDRIDHDLGASAIIGTDNPTVGIPSTYTIRFRNNGIADQSSYTVKLMDENDVELASVAGPPISSLQTMEVSIPWTPTIAGNYTIHGKLELSGDEVSANDLTPNLDLIVNPEGVETITVGRGNKYESIPFYTQTMYSLFQTIFYAQEMERFSGQITGIRLYNYFFWTYLQNTPISIWLGTTSQTNLIGGYIPSTQLNLVFAGLVDFPSGENTISIVFDEPFDYTDGRNLVMMLYRSADDFYYGNDYFRCQHMEPNRSIYAVRDYDPFDPAAPPVGYLMDLVPKTTFLVIPTAMGTISGGVTDADGNPIVGATVTSGPLGTTTNSAGTYNLIVPTGCRDVTASAHGFETVTIDDILVNPDETTTVNFVLEPQSAGDDPQIPVLTTTLKGNYPNPFNPETTISYSVKEAGRVKLEVYNLKGQLVRTLVDEDHAAGHYKRVFDSRDDRGRSISSGVYLVRMSAPGYQKSSKMMLTQ